MTRTYTGAGGESFAARDSRPRRARRFPPARAARRDKIPAAVSLTVPNRVLRHDIQKALPTAPRRRAPRRTLPPRPFARAAAGAPPDGRRAVAAEPRAAAVARAAGGRKGRGRDRPHQLGA